MTDFLAGTINSEPVRSASRDADSLAALAILGADGVLDNPDAVAFSAHAIEVVALRLALAGDDGATDACREAFDLLRAVLQHGGSRSRLSALEISRLRTRAAVFGLLGELHAQTRRLLAGRTDVAINGVRWGATTELAVLEVWQLLIRKHGWADLDQLRQIIGRIRDQQATNEPQYLEQHAEARDGWRLVAVYHLLRAAEIVAEYTEHGSADSLFDPVEQAELHFDRTSDASTEAGDADTYWFGGAYHGDGIYHNEEDAAQREDLICLVDRAHPSYR